MGAVWGAGDEWFPMAAGSAHGTALQEALIIDPELRGLGAIVGIRKGQPFAPDERLTHTLTEAVAVAKPAHGPSRSGIATSVPT